MIVDAPVFAPHADDPAGTGRTSSLDPFLLLGVGVSRGRWRCERRVQSGVAAQRAGCVCWTRSSSTQMMRLAVAHEYHAHPPEPRVGDPPGTRSIRRYGWR